MTVQITQETTTPL